MFRFAVELFFTILIVLIARAVLTSLMKGFTNAAQNGSRQAQPNASAAPRQPQGGPASQPSGELHKDPVCGTYVAESTQFRRQVGGQSFYYCSEACREKHALVAR